MNIAGRELLVVPGIGKVGEVIDRIVEIEIVIVHAVHEILQIVDARHGETALEDVGMLEQRVGGVIRAKGSAHRGDGELRFAVVPDEGDDLLAKIRIENGLDIAAMERVRALIVEAEAVDGIDGEEFDAAGIDEIAKRTDHALTFELPLIAGAGWKTQEWWTPVAVNGNAEFEAQAMRMPAMNFTFHVKSPSEPRVRSMPAPTVTGQCICAGRSEYL